MEDTTFLYSVLGIALLVAISYALKPKSRKNLPPTPPSIPIIGHLHLLKPPVHRSLLTLSQKYGPVLSLRFGSRLVVVVSSIDAAEECFTKNDVVFANRPDFAVSKCLSYNHTTLGAAPYGDHWRKLRRVSALEILSANRLNTNSAIRRDEVRRLVNKLSQSSRDDFARVEFKSMVKELTLNITMRMVAGKRYYGEETDESSEAMTFRAIVDELFEFMLAQYPADFLPILKYIDFQGFMKRAKKLIKRVDAFWQGIVDEHRTNQIHNQEMENSMVAHFLKLQESQPQYYTDDIIKGLILTMVLGGSDTTAVTIEWAMSNLLNHPTVLKKARAELETQLGDQLLEESEVPKLSYLRCIVLETLRLYPAGPLLLPHKSSADCTLSGYDVPRDTILLVNAWAIHRDPTLWEDPTSFRPERFEGGDGEANSKLMIAFGLGRRACPGSGMAHRVLGLTLGLLIQCFDWKSIDGKDVDMTEGKGVSMPKAEPLEALCKPRPIASKLLL
ncbi:isoflavone 2'-hydroxylase-like [Cucurbita pepo subsp. pepo]|uniref:isoflavone 2'-hydroxylase-like n=1 Tax=Cucurbita pepo subsp. pepo TaxID=3664 RepID=UPI000C9D3174|nr:isoflavone 2'-hydroxylase-like [Cucurbita pepo subsp. pepo]